MYFNLLLEGCTDVGDGFNLTSTDIPKASSYVVSFLETETNMTFSVNEVMLKLYTFKAEATCKTVWNKVATKLSVLADGGDTDDDTAATRKIRAPTLAQKLGLSGIVILIPAKLVSPSPFANSNLNSYFLLQQRKTPKL